MIFGMLLNTKTHRWHPILFRPAPMPGDPEMKIPRYKSKGHHTEGFETEDEALGYILTACEQHGFENRTDEYQALWNGEEVPLAMTYFAPKVTLP